MNIDDIIEIARLKGRLIALEAEVERLKAEIETVRQVAQDNKTETESTRIENARLKAEVERLRKVVKIADGAVDCVLQVHDYGYAVSTEYANRLRRIWNAAKDGKPTE